MTEYQIEANTRRCAATGRELQPGETYYSVLLQEGDSFHRRDYSAESWQGPPEGAFSFWTGRIPAAQHHPRPRIDDEVLLDCLERLAAEGEPGRLRFRYVVALLLMRRKRLRFEEVRVEDGREVLSLRCSRTRALYHVANPCMTESEMLAVQEEVLRVLGWQ